VPGNFHISNYAFSDIVQQMEMKGLYLDNSFRIDHVSFGEKQNFQRIKSGFPEADIQHPIDGLKSLAET
jgi:hypothetical protein